MRAWEFTELNDKINSLGGSIAMAKLEIVRARESIHSNNCSIEELESESQTLKNKNSELISDIAESQQSIKDNTAHLDKLRAKLAEATGDIPEPPKPWQVNRPQTEASILSFCGGSK